MRSKLTLLALMAVAGIFSPVMASAASVGTGGADDVPTWKVGDRWDFNRGFQINLTITLNISGISGVLPLPLNLTDNHRKTVSQVLEVNNPTTTSVGVKTTVAYQRDRDPNNTSFNVNGNGSAAFVGGLATLTVALTGVATKTVGYDWVAVGDLALVREHLATQSPITGNAQITAGGALGSVVCGNLPAPLACGANPFTLNFDFSIDHGAKTGQQSGGLEYLDFPAANADEQWTQGIRRNISGLLDLNVANGGLAFNQDFESGLDGDFAVASPLKVVNTSVTSPAPGSFAACIQTQGLFNVPGVAGNDVVYYSRTAKEMVSWVLGDINGLINIPDTGSGVGVVGDLKLFKTTINSGGAVSVDLGSTVSNVSYETGAVTALGASGGTVCVSGTAPAGSAVAGVLLVPGANQAPVATTADGAGAFSLTINVPATDDDSPATGASVDPDQGSFGLALFLDGAVTPAKVVSIRRSSTADAGASCGVATDTASPTPTETETPSPTPTETPVVTATDSPSPTPTPGPTSTGCPTGGRANGDFDCSGCTDIADFLTLLDNWQLELDGTIVDIADFLALLDNWQLGPGCDGGTVTPTPPPSPTP